MAEPFKNNINAALVDRIGVQMRNAWAGFPLEEFRRKATDGLDGLELKERGQQVGRVLAELLPKNFKEAAETIEATLAPAPEGDEISWEGRKDEKLFGWAVWPLTECVAVRGLEQPERALECLRQLTQRASSEFAVRPFLAADPEGTLKVFKKWIHDPSAHVRRLVSEGSRPRLPWGLRLQVFVKDPSPCVELLDLLRSDSSEYVRRSVANHLNDISKDHPEMAMDIAERWLKDGTTTTGKIVHHALRSLVKAGNARAMTLLGFGGGAKIEATRFRVTPKKVALGGKVTVSCTLGNRGAKTANLVIDYAVHHMKAAGERRPKVFKGTKRKLAAGETTEITINHSLKEVTTRRYYAGRHEIELLVNGRCVGKGSFDLKTD